LGKTLRPLPEKFHGLEDQEICYRERNLDLITNTDTRLRFQQRSAMIREIREFFWEKNFQEIETSILQAQAGGAMAKVFKTHHNALDHNFVLRISLASTTVFAIKTSYCFRNQALNEVRLFSSSSTYNTFNFSSNIKFRTYIINFLFKVNFILVPTPNSDSTSIFA
jgi:hypothetical protein